MSKTTISYLDACEIDLVSGATGTVLELDDGSGFGDIPPVCIKHPPKIPELFDDDIPEEPN